jgi:hypothetical protein
MIAVIIDTNVAVVANGRGDEDTICILNCSDELRRIMSQGVVLLDEIGYILQEYLRHLSLAGQPGVGDAFVKWINDHQGYSDRVVKVSITPTDTSGYHFAEFPAVEALAKFDRSDRKFVAVALASGLNPEILNAVDSDWSNFQAALDGAGVRLRQLCPQHITKPVQSKNTPSSGRGGRSRLM